MNQAMNHTLRVFLICLLALAGCRPTFEVAPVNSNPGTMPTYTLKTNSYAELFEVFWQGMNENYVFWDLEPVSYWDEVWDTYKPVFDALGSYPGSNPVSARNQIAAMVTPLRDGHLAILMPATTVAPAVLRVGARYSSDTNKNPYDLFWANNWSNVSSSGRPNSNIWDLTIKNYMQETPTVISSNDGFTIINISQTPTPNHFHAAAGRITTGLNTGEYILYLHFNQFVLYETLINKPVIQEPLHWFFQELLKPGCRGLILDIRGNGGGSVIDIPWLLGPLLDQDLLIAHTRYKKGPGRLDYLPYMPYYLKAATAQSPWRAKNAGNMAVVALVNGYSVSCAEITALAVRTMGGKIVGDRTWGATGTRYGDISPDTINGGAFTIAAPNGSDVMQVIEAGFQFRGPHFESYEGAGIEPDYWVDFNAGLFTGASRRDVQLEKAITLTRNRIVSGSWHE